MLKFSIPYPIQWLFIYKEYSILPVGVIKGIEYNIPLSDIPPNNSKRMSFLNSDLHVLYSKNNEVFDAILKDGEIEKKFIGYGKNPVLSMDSSGNLYAVWAYNDTSGVEEVRFSRYIDTIWDLPISVCDNFNTYFWGIGAPSFNIEKDKGYITWETTRGPCYHTQEPPYPCIQVILEDKVLMYGEFNIFQPDSFKAYDIDYIRIVGPEPVEVPREVFYDSVVPTLVSPSLVVDAQDAVHLVWEGVYDSLRYYNIKDTSIIRKVFTPVYTDSGVSSPYISENNSQITFCWAETGGTESKILSSYTFTGQNLLSGAEEVFTNYEYYIKEPFTHKNYIVFVEKNAFYEDLIFGELKTPFEGEILFSAPSIRSPQILYDETDKKFHITFYAGNDTIYNLYKVEKQVSEAPPDLVINFGKETKEPVTIYREGYISFGIEDYKNLDFGDSLVYEIPLYHASKVKLVLSAYLDKDIKEKIYVNGHPRGVWHIKENEQGVFEKYIPEPAIDTILRIRIEKKKGDKVYLGKLKIYIEEKKGKGGIQGAGLTPFLNFSLKILPSIIKEKAIFEIMVPERQKVNLSIYDISGRKILTPLNKFLNPGIHRIKLDIKKLKKGVYFAILKGNKKRIRKFVVLR